MRLRSKRDTISYVPSIKCESCSITSNKEPLECEITIGGYYYVKVTNNMEDESNYRIGEVLAVRINDENIPEYYITYASHNRRLDEWVRADQIDTKREMEIKHEDNMISNVKSPMILEDSQDDVVTFASETPVKSEDSQDNFLYSPDSPASQLLASSEVNGDVGDDDSNLMHDGSPDLKYLTPPPSISSNNSSPKIDEPSTAQINQDKPRVTSGGKSFKPVKRRVKNIKEIQMGEDLIEPWYFSPYPEEFNGAPVVYICEFCLSYYISELQFRRHKKKCNLFHPPGNQIYKDEKENLAMFEVNGERQPTYCQSLCLLSKLFLDHKLLAYDTLPFLFYILCYYNEDGYCIIGYFSKEKYNMENNLACILTLPQHQRKGYGRFLIAFSYTISKMQGKVGTPEKPLSDLGLLSYQQYWMEAITEVLLKANEEISVDEIAYQTGIDQKDVQYTLHLIGICVYLGQPCIKISNGLIEMVKGSKAKRRCTIKNEYFDQQWVPLVYNPVHCRFL
ncbi:16485_t:CDS:1 [Funneliformis geosporum]|uniref:Histone acetyltransferase ESA1 n=1 Tax=Funneliformis geosporum TaxID=1117311 RepID=A0A9W4X465_9GLOM|nr:12482_t:CDS:1 [Funneliformis geosporum]CAI2185458.1 16485_t:CDS:1 [Funneliformis geosporum]